MDASSSASNPLVGDQVESRERSDARSLAYTSPSSSSLSEIVLRWATSSLEGGLPFVAGKGAVTRFVLRKGMGEGRPKDCWFTVRFGLTRELPPASLRWNQLIMGLPVRCDGFFCSAAG